MKTQKELYEYVKAESINLMDHSAEALVGFLDYEFARAWLNKDVTEEQWNKVKLPYTEAAVRNEINKYVDFAIEKAENQRGLSALRSRSKMKAWTFALGHDQEFNWEYEDYGLRLMKHIKERYQE